MAVRIVSFAEVPVGVRFWMQEGKDWNTYVKFSESRAQRDSALLGVELESPISVDPKRKSKMIY